MQLGCYASMVEPSELGLVSERLYQTLFHKNTAIETLEVVDYMQ